MDENYVAQLNEYVQKRHCELKYDDVGSDGPAHIKIFTQRVILNGKTYPEGVGKNKKEAKQNAAKHALDALERDQNTSPTSGLSVSNSSQPVYQPTLTQPNYICWLNEQSQKNRFRLQAEEFTTVDQGHATPSCRFVLDGRRYPTAIGRTKKEAKEEAAKLVFQEICSNPPSKTMDQSFSVESSHQTNELNQDISEAIGKLGNLLEVSTKEHHLTATNFIGILNHYCQKTVRHLEFSLVRKCGPPHCPQFFYKVVIGSKEYPEVEGSTAKEAKQKAAHAAWSALQEQSDWDSKVSEKSAVSEEDATSNTAPTEPASFTSTSSGGIQFKNTSEPPKGKKMDIKPKIKLAVKFPKAPNEHSKEDVFPDSKISNTGYIPTSTSATTNSRFTKDFDNIEPIGKGGFGRVFKARQKHLNMNYAIKIVRCKEKALREAGVLADLQHPNIVRYYTSWIEHSDYKYVTSESSSTSQSSTDASVPYLYIQMELCELKTLKVWIDEKNTLRSNRDPTRRKESLDIMRKLICGVEYIHSKNLIHRDLKPGNIMFKLDGEVKIGDFGLVTEDNDDDDNLLERTRSTGTKTFMAPEQRSKIVYDRKVDIFALGLVYFRMLWKQLHHEMAKDWSDLRNQTFPPDFAQKYPKEKMIIFLMLHDNPKDRPYAKEIKDELERSDFLQGSKGSSEE